MSRLIVLVVVDGGPGADQWAGDVLGRLLGRPEIDARIFELTDDTVDGDSTQRLMLGQMAGRAVWLSRRRADEVAGRLAELAVGVVQQPELLAGQSDPDAAAAAVIDHAASSDDDRLEGWLERLDEEG